MGPGFGECAVLHLGYGEWLIVDSCLDDAGAPAALSYLGQIGVDTEVAVRMIVVTHWHDDHIRGIARIVQACPNADFVCPVAFRSDDFLTLVAAYTDGAMMLESGIQEMADTLAIVDDRGTTARLASENKLLFRRHECEVWALSPSDAAVTSAMVHLKSQMPQLMASKAALAAPTPNHLSIALLATLRDRAILLGGDVLESSDRNRGWWRIADLHSTYGHPVSDIVKVPHHGSIGADCDRMWDQLVRSQPIGVLTSFALGRVSLPSAGDINRICGRTSEAYLTSQPRKTRPRRRNPAVEKTVAGLLQNRRLRSPKLGRITLRSGFSGNSKWTAYLEGAACRLSPVAE